MAKIKPLGDYKLFSYEALVTIMNERPITAADWESRINKRNWVSADGDWFPLSSPYFIGGAVTEFVVRRVFTDTNEVEILVDIDPLVPGGTLRVMDADLLALYCEAS